MTEQNIRPRAITTWDFSWPERRWPGAGYEEWHKALDRKKFIVKSTKKRYTLHEKIAMLLWSFQAVGTREECG